uniref:Uncharacterized protein n=1 Tax=Brassica campestris TaxID=3711 RepID=A0A3P6AUQ7_BRACM|nr:unnamed protein product [Brassica rapa]
MNLELPVFDGFRCHYRLLRVQVKLISELFNGCLEEQLSLPCLFLCFFSFRLCSLSLVFPDFQFINQFLLVVHPFKLKDDQQMGLLFFFCPFCYGVSVSGKLSRLLKGRFSTLLSLSSSNEEGSRCKLQVPSSSKVLRMQYNVFQFFCSRDSVVWCFVGFEGSNLWFHKSVSG